MEIKTTEEILKEEKTAEATRDNTYFNYLKKKWITVDDVRELLKEFMFEIPDMLIKKFENALSETTPKKKKD